MSTTTPSTSDLAAEIRLLKEENRHLKQLLFEDAAKDVSSKCISMEDPPPNEKSHLHVPHASSDPSSCNSSQSQMSRQSSSGFDDLQNFSSDNETTGFAKPSTSFNKRFLKRRLKGRDKKRSRSLDEETILQTQRPQDCSLKLEPEEVERSNSIGARRLAPILTITVPSTEEIYQSELSNKDDKHLKDKARDMSRNASIDMSVPCPKLPDDVRMCQSAPSSPKKPASFLYDPDKAEQDNGRGSGDLSNSSSGVGSNKNTMHEIQKHYRLLQKRLSQEFSRKMPQWDMNRIRHPLSSCRGLSLPCKEDGVQGLISGKEDTMQSIVSENLSADFRKKLDEWNKMKCTSEHVPSSPQTPHTPHTAPPHFKKLIPDWPKWRSVNLKPELFTSHDLGSNPRAPSCQTEHVCSRKTYAGGKGVNIAWIDREVHKIEREKTRLDKEKEKCEKKIQRLEKMRLAIGSRIRMKEVLIPTSSGLLRFPGISRKFTQKLYEWEKAQGIGPEASTFALLDSSYQPELKDIREKFKASEKRTLTRSRSLGSVHDTTKGISRQPSSLSLNDMDELQDASNVTGTEVICSHSSDDCSETRNLSPNSWTTDCLHILQELFFDLEELEEIECDFSTLKSNLISNKEEMIQITDQLQEYLSDTDKIFNDSNNELKLKIQGLQQRKDDLFREEAEMQILYITYCNKMINLSEKQVSDSKYVKHISDRVLELNMASRGNNQSMADENRSRMPSCCIQSERQIADFVNEKAAKLIHNAKEIRDILKQSEQKLYRNYSNAMESESLQECIHNFNQLSSTMKTDITTMKEYLIPYSPGYKEDSPVFNFDTVQGEEDSMDEPMVEFLKAQPSRPSDVPDAPQNTSPVNVEEIKTFNMIIPNVNDDKPNPHGNEDEKLRNKSSSDDERKTSPGSQGRKLKKKVRRRRKSDLKRQHSFDKGDDLSDREQVLSTSDDDINRFKEDISRKDNRKTKDNSETTAKEKRLQRSKSREGEYNKNLADNRLGEFEQKHVSLSDLVHYSDGSPVLESKFKMKSVTTEPGKVCVPTIRKIFTPVVDDTSGNPCVVGYVLRSAEMKEQTGQTLTDNSSTRDENPTDSLDLDNCLEYIDKSDDNDNEKTSNTSLQAEHNEQHLANKRKHKNADGNSEDLKEKHKSEKLPSIKDGTIKEQTKHFVSSERLESSKIKSIIEKYNKLTSVPVEEPPSPPTTKPKFSSKIKELSEVFDTDASSKHSSQEISVPVRDDSNLKISKIGETYQPQDSREFFTTLIESKDKSKPTQTSDKVTNAVASTTSEKTPQVPPLVLDDRNHQGHKTKLQLAKEEFLSNMACERNQNLRSEGIHLISPATTSGNNEATNSRNKTVQKSFSSGMINTLSNSYGRLNKETTQSNESHVTKPKKKTTRSFREKFNTLRLRFRKPKSDKNLLHVGDSLDTGMNDEADGSARTSTHSIASNCSKTSKTSAWRRFFDR